MELKINKILDEIIPPLEPEKFKALKDSIKEKGLFKPIDVMTDGTIIDGHNRFKACQELKIIPLYSIMPNIKTIEEALDFSFEINFRRRQLNPFRQAEWAVNILKAKDKLHSKKPGDLSQERCEALAHKVGISDTTIQRSIKIVEDAPDKIKERLRNAEVGIKDVYEFMTTLDKFPKEKKEEFEIVFKEGKVETSALKKIYGITQEAENTLADYNELVQAQVKPNFEQDFYTSKFDDKRLKQMSHDLLVASGGNPQLVTKFMESTEFADDAEAHAYAKKLGGRVVGKVTKIFYEMEIDPLKE